MIPKINEVYHGDCLEGMRQYPDNFFDVVISDPPYGIDIGKMGFVNDSKQFKNLPTDWDKNAMSEEQFKEMQRISKNQVIFGGNYFTDYLPVSRCWVTWDKRVKEIKNDFSDCELIWTSFDRPARMIRFRWGGSTQDYTKLERENRYHPTQKPIEVMKRVLDMFSKKGDLILDPFGGSGSTGVAAAKTGRKYVMYEKEWEYYQICLDRIKEVSEQMGLQAYMREVV